MTRIANASNTAFARKDILMIPQKGHEIKNGLGERNIYIYIIEFPRFYCFRKY
jgi:hypothetical protein